MMNVFEKIIKDAPGNSALCLLQGEHVWLSAYSPSIPVLFGYTEQEFKSFVQDDLLNFIFQTDRASALEHLKESETSGKEETISCRIKHRRGDYFWKCLTVKYIDAKKEYPAFLITIQENTQEAAIYAQLLSQSKNIIYVCDGKTYELLYANQAALQYWGKGEDYKGRACYNFIRGDNAVCPWCSIDKVIDGTFHSKAIYDPEQQKFFQVDCTQIKWYERDAYSIFCMDVTESKHSEASYNRLVQELLNSSSESRGTFLLNLTKNTCDTGHNASALVQKMREAGTADNFLENIAKAASVANDDAKVRATFNRTGMINAFHNGQRCVKCDYRRLVENGEIHWVHCFINMFQNPTTGDIEAISDARDINDQKKNEVIIQRLTAFNYDFVALIDIKTRMISFTDVSQGKEVFSTPSSYDEEILYAVEHLTIPEERDFCRKNTALENIVSQLSHAETYAYTFTQPGTQGLNFRKELKFCWFDDSHREIIAIKRDISASYQAAQEQMQKLQTALKAVKRANQAKSAFLSNMSHDMRTPMNAILGMSHLALNLHKEKDTLREYIEKINISAQYLLQIINDTLDMSWIESDKVALVPEPFQFSQFQDRLVSLMGTLAEAKHIEFSVTGHELSGMALLFDRTRLEQIFVNLLNNAIKFTPPYGKVELDVTTLRQENGICDMRFIVRDNGIGMSPKFIKVMYKPFEQEHRKEADTNVGTGLGLSITQKLVELMGGTISVQSKENEGTVFTVLLSAPLATAVPDKAQISESGEAANNLQGKRILLVEDNEINMEIAKALLQEKGMIVDTAANGADALKLVKEANDGYYGAILMDIRMPIMDGLEAAKKIRSLKRAYTDNVPIIAMTANAFEEDIQKSRKAGMNAHLAKPVDPDNLYRTLSLYLSK